MFRLRSSKSRRAPLALSAQQRAQWDEHGYLVLPGFFDDALLDRLEAEIAHWWSDQTAANPLVIDVLEGEHQGRRMHMADAPRETRSVPHKLNDLYLASEQCRRLVLAQPLVDILHELLDDDPVVINSLNFGKGSQQPYHFDTYFMPPPVEGNMAVTSICLEDVHPDAGPLMYYPGSHRIAPFRFGHGGLNQGDESLDAATAYIQGQIADAGIEPETFCGSRGDVFVWHAQLYHGGSPIQSGERTRRSLVTHYWGRTGIDGNVVPAESAGHYLKRDHPAVG